MAINLSTEDLRKSISKEIIFNPFLIEQVSIGLNTIEADKQALQKEDLLNKMFMNLYHIDIGGNYETERQNLNGYIPTTFTELDISDAVASLDTSLFFPISPIEPFTDTWKFLIPKIVDEVNGIGGTTSINNEQKALSDLSDFIDFIQIGFNYGAGSVELQSTYIVGSGVMSVDANSFNDNDYLYITGSIFKIISGGGTVNFVVEEFIPPTSSIPALSTLSRTFSGFTNSERENMIAGDQNNLNNLATYIDDKITEWIGYVTAQNISISANLDDRTTQLSELTNATSNNTATIAVLNSWKSLSYSGVGAKYTDAGLLVLKNEISTRNTIVNNRISEINIALGIVVDVGDGTFSGVSGEIYYERYKWLDTRINKVYGSAGGAVQKDYAKSLVQMQIDNLQLKIDEFSPYMMVTTFTVGTEGPDEQEDDAIPTNILEVDSVSNFSNGDLVYVASDIKPEIQTKIIHIDTQNKTFTFDTEIPLGYTIFDNARVYRVL